MYKDLKERREYNIVEEALADDTSGICELLLRLNNGITEQHSKNILNLYFYHLYLTDKEKYEAIKNSAKEETVRQVFDGKVITTYSRAEKIVSMYSDLFYPEFLGIIAAYVGMTDELSSTRKKS